MLTHFPGGCGITSCLTQNPQTMSPWCSCQNLWEGQSYCKPAGRFSGHSFTLLTSKRSLEMLQPTGNGEWTECGASWCYFHALIVYSGVELSNDDELFLRGSSPPCSPSNSSKLTSYSLLWSIVDTQSGVTRRLFIYNSEYDEFDDQRKNVYNWTNLYLETKRNKQKNFRVLGIT